MAFAVTVAGQGSFYRFAVACASASTAGVEKEFKHSLKQAGDHIAKNVAAHTDRYMPRGFEKTFRTSLNTRVNVRFMQVTIIGSARGKARRRDVERMEEGILRHPVFGRWRERRGRYRRRHRLRNSWVAQRIRPGWFSEPADEAGPAAFEKLNAAVGRVIDQIGSAR